MKRIGVDIQATVGRATGLGTFTANLAGELRAIEKASCDLSFLFYQDPQGTDWRTPRRLFWENVEIPRKARRDGVDLLHIPAFAAPAIKPPKMVVTVHDLIGMLFPNQIGWVSRFYWGKWLPWTVRRADRIIADSKNTQKDLIRCLGVPAGKIRVVYPSGHEGFSRDAAPEAVCAVKTRLRIRGRYFLFVGTLEPRKNLSGAIRAFSEFLRGTGREDDFQMVIVGSKSFAHGRFFKAIGEVAGSNNLLFTDYISREDLKALYCGATALVYPSFYEGFGIPVLEAMACGAPVIASAASSVPEVAGDAAMLVDPNDVPAIARAMTEIASQEALRREMIAKGLRQIEKFSWKKTAAETVDVYRELLG